MVEKNQKINEYRLALIFGGGAFVIALILIFAVGLPIYNNYSKTASELKTQKTSLQALEDKLSTLKTLQSQEETLKKQNETVLAALPEDKDVSRLFVQFENIANQNGLAISSVSEGGTGATPAATSKPSGTLTPVTYTVSATATDYDHLKQALSKIQSALRVISIDKIDVSGTGGSLTATFNVTTYVRGTAK